MKKTIIFAFCLLIMAIALESCNDHKNEAASNMFTGVWEISSKDDLEEDGTSIEHILELKTGNSFTETFVFYNNQEQLYRVSVEGEYGVEETADQNRQNNFAATGYTLWRMYNIDSMDIVTTEENQNELAEEYKELFSQNNMELENARKEGMCYGLFNVRDEGDLTWETDETISEQFPDVMKKRRAKRIIKETPANE